MIAYANYTSSPKFITVVWAVEKNFLPPSQPCHTYMYGHVRQNMYAEDFCNLDPLLSSIRFNTPCFLVSEGCCVCNLCPSTEYYVALQGEYWFTYHVKKVLVHSVVFNMLTCFYFPLYLLLSIRWSQWIRFHS